MAQNNDSEKMSQEEVGRKGGTTTNRQERDLNQDNTRDSDMNQRENDTTANNNLDDM